MLTPDQIRKLIVPKPWKHDWRLKGNIDPERQLWFCNKCEHEEIFKSLRGISTGQFIPAVLNKQAPDCPKPDKIELDWKLAMKMRDACMNKHCWPEAQLEIWEEVVGSDEIGAADFEERYLRTFEFFANKSEPIHYIAAAIEAKGDKP